MESDGMKTLAATCMLIEAIGEGIKKIDVLNSLHHFTRVNSSNDSTHLTDSLESQYFEGLGALITIPLNLLLSLMASGDVT